MLSGGCADDTEPVATGTAAASDVHGAEASGGAETTDTVPTDVPDDGNPSSIWPVDPRAEGDARWGIEIVARMAHDVDAFTQGLEFIDGRLFESTGRRGQSRLRELDSNGGVIRSVALEDALFGEGLTVVGDQIVQLTWTAGVALRWDLETFELLEELTYEGEGWGLCHTGHDFIMSNGTAVLTRRDTSTFDVIGQVEVRLDGEPVTRINELECVDDLVIANVWNTDDIIVIDPLTGNVLASIDASALAPLAGTTDTDEVLNGIADAGDGTLLLGGKNWQWHFVVRITLD